MNGPVTLAVYQAVSDASPAGTIAAPDGLLGGTDSRVRARALGGRRRRVHVADQPRPTGTVHRVRSWLLDALAFLLVLAALLAPNRVEDLTPWVFLRLPIEAVAAAAILLVLPPRMGRLLAVIGGAVLGLLAVGKIFDMGFYEILLRPFDPVLDWGFVSDGVEFVSASVGGVGAIAAVVVAVLLAVAVLTLTALAALRLAHATVTHRAPAIRAVAVLTVLWAGLAMLGVEVAPHQPAAARSAVVPAYDRALQVVASVRDRALFARQSTVDAFATTPASQLLTALRGKNVILVFVESYGRSALEDPGLARTVVPALDAGAHTLQIAGFAAKSAFLTSPTVGGGSILAHSTLLSGLWVDNAQRYRTLMASDRFTLDRAFERAGWRTVGIMPGNTGPWPDASFYGFDRVYDSHQLGYQGPNFSWSPVPDQYVLAAMQRLELAHAGHPPVLAEVPLVSSHTPWAPLPRLIGWNDLGDGSVFRPMAASGTQPGDIWPDPAKVRAAYAASVAYSLNCLFSYVQTYGDDDTVLVVLGDHQPAPIVTGGDGAGRDVPITIISRDRAVLARVSRWGWQDGVEPTRTAPVWRMDAFRDRFLTAFGAGGTLGSASPSAPAAGLSHGSQRPTSEARVAPVR